MGSWASSAPAFAVVSFAWTTLSWLVLGVAFWLVLKASGIGLSPLAGLLVVIGIGLAMILPSPPAAIGVFEGATVVVLTAYGVNNSEALSYALVLHALNVLPLFAVALGVLAYRRLPWWRRAAPTAAPSRTSTPTRAAPSLTRRCRCGCSETGYRWLCPGRRHPGSTTE